MTSIDSNFSINYLINFSEGTREAVLKKNFTTLKPVVHVFSQEEPIKPSNYQIMKLTFKYLFNTSQILKTIAYTIILIALPIVGTIGLKFLVTLNLKEEREKIGKFFDLVTYRDGIEVNRKYNVRYTLKDFRAEYINNIVFAVIVELLILIGTHTLYENNPFFKTFGKLKIFYNNPNHCPRPIINVPSAIANCNIQQLANEQENDQFIDPLSLASITEEELRSPRTLLIGQYALSTQTSLKHLFRDLSVPRGETIIPHLAENRYLTRQEQDKLLDDLAALLCIEDKQTLLNCWNVSHTQLADKVNTIIDKEYSQTEWEAMDHIQQRECKNFLAPQLISICKFENLIKISPKNLPLYLDKEMLDYTYQFLSINRNTN